MTRIPGLILVMLVVVACGGSRMQAPDVVETKVAQALTEMAVQTERAPTATATSTPTLTSAATSTPTSTPTATPTVRPTRTPTRTPRPTRVPTATPTPTATASTTPEPEPTSTRAPTAVPRTCCPFSAMAEFTSEVPVETSISLNGPEQVTLRVPGGGKARYCLVPGSYTYSASATGYSPAKGTDFFGYTPQDCICRAVYVEASAPTPDPCEANPYSWECRLWRSMQPVCDCKADPSLYGPAALKPGTRPWTMQQASAHCSNPSLCVILPAPGSAIRGNVHIVGSANAESFQRYKVEWWAQGGSGWAFLLERNTPVVNGELLMLNTSTVPEGRYGLRLTVVDPSGNYGEPFEIWWTVMR